MRDIIRLGLILLVICGVAAAGLAAVYNTTSPLIEAQRETKLQQALQAAVPGADAFEAVTVEGRTHYVARKGNEVIGAAALVAARGYGSDPIEMLIGVDGKGKILSVVITSMSETPGIGTRAKEAFFLNQFTGKTVDDPIEVGSDIDGISGASISARAVAGGVKSAAGVLKADFLGQLEPKKVIDFASIPDGDYTGEGKGFGGMIKVRVTVKDHRITAIGVLAHTESAGVCEPAFAAIPSRIVEKQGLDVDVVTAATFTSRGILAAVEDALKAYVTTEGDPR
jgi:electron transport complex protein RnfG